MNKLISFVLVIVTLIVVAVPVYAEALTPSRSEFGPCPNCGSPHVFEVQLPDTTTHTTCTIHSGCLIYTHYHNYSVSCLICGEYLGERHEIVYQQHHQLNKSFMFHSYI